MNGDAEKLAERFATVRPGYKLLACEEAALPFFVVTAPVLLQQKKPVRPVDEFILHGILQGLKTSDELALFLGLDHEILIRSLSRLWQNDLVDMPISTEGRFLRLTSNGEKTLSELTQMVSVERDVWFPFDRLLWKPVPFLTTLLLQPKDVKEQNLLIIKPKFNKRPEAIDLSVKAVDSAIKESMKSVVSDADVLVVKRVDRAEQKYLQCHALIYESFDGTDHVIEIAIDGRLSNEVRDAIESLGGTRYLGFEFSPPAKLSPNELALLENISTRTKLKMVTTDEIEVIRRRLVHKSDDSISPDEIVENTYKPVAIESIEYRNIDTHEHPEFLLQSLKEAKVRLLITCPFVRRSVVTKEFIYNLESTAKRGVVIHIGYGIVRNAYEERDSSDADAVEKLVKLGEKFPNVVVASLTTHAKILIWDDVQIVTSFNWLSFRGDKNRTYRQEVGALLKNGGKLTEDFWIEQRDWIERAGNKKVMSPS